MDAPPQEQIPIPPVTAPPPTQRQAPARPAKGEEARAFAEEHGIRRNAPCPCGSGQKFKKCCGRTGAGASA